MSLIRVRRSRKQSWIEQKRGLPPRRLAIFLIFVIAVIWYLGRL